MYFYRAAYSEHQPTKRRWKTLVPRPHISGVCRSLWNRQKKTLSSATSCQVLMTFYRKSGQQDVLELVLMHVKLSENSIVMAGRELIWLFHTSKSTSKPVLENSAVILQSQNRKNYNGPSGCTCAASSYYNANSVLFLGCITRVSKCESWVRIS